MAKAAEAAVQSIPIPPATSVEKQPISYVSLINPAYICNKTFTDRLMIHSTCAASLEVCKIGVLGYFYCNGGKIQKAIVPWSNIAGITLVPEGA